MRFILLAPFLLWATVIDCWISQCCAARKKAACHEEQLPDARGAPIELLPHWVQACL